MVVAVEGDVNHCIEMPYQLSVCIKWKSVEGENDLSAYVRSSSND